MMQEIMGTSNRRQQAEDALLNYCLAQPSLQSLVKEFDVGRAILKELYSRLYVSGAGQWAGGHWVAASALAYPHTLRFLLTSLQGGASAIEQSHALVMHFERGAPLP